MRWVEAQLNWKGWLRLSCTEISGAETGNNNACKSGIGSVLIIWSSNLVRYPLWSIFWGNQRRKRSATNLAGQNLLQSPQRIPWTEPKWNLGTTECLCSTKWEKGTRLTDQSLPLTDVFFHMWTVLLLPLRAKQFSNKLAFACCCAPRRTKGIHPSRASPGAPK
jgi:hypothetical protein